MKTLVLTNRGQPFAPSMKVKIKTIPGKNYVVVKEPVVFDARRRTYLAIPGVEEISTVGRFDVFLRRIYLNQTINVSFEGEARFIESRVVSCLTINSGGFARWEDGDLGAEINVANGPLEMEGVDLGQFFVSTGPVELVYR